VERAKKNISTWLFLYGLAFAFFQVVPALISGMWRSPITQGDALDFLTPLAVVPILLGVYTRIKVQLPGKGTAPFSRVASGICLVVGVIEYVDGHGIHLPSNSLSRLLEEGTSVFRAAYLYDEVISHYIWDGGVILISAGLILLAARLKPGYLTKREGFWLAAGAALYGFTFFANGIEGQTVLMTFPAAAVGFGVSVYLFLREVRTGSANPVLAFYGLGYLVSVVLFATWGIVHSGFPEFSALGWIS